MEFFVGKKILIESECKRKSLTGLSLHLNGHFPGGPGLAATRMYPFWILLELRVMEVVVTTGAIRQSNCHHQQTNTQLFYRPDALPVTQPTPSCFTGGMPFLSLNQQCQSTEEMAQLRD